MLLESMFMLTNTQPAGVRRHRTPKHYWIPKSTAHASSNLPRRAVGPLHLHAYESRTTATATSLHWMYHESNRNPRGRAHWGNKLGREIGRVQGTASIHNEPTMEIVEQEHAVWFDLSTECSLSKFVDEMAGKIKWGRDQQLLVWGRDRESDSEWKVTTDEQFRQMMDARRDVNRMDVCCEVLDKDKDSSTEPTWDAKEMDVNCEVLRKGKDSSRIPRWDARKESVPTQQTVRAKSGAKADKSDVMGKENEDFSSHVSSDSLAIARTVDTLEVDAEKNESIQRTKCQQSSSYGGISSDRSNEQTVHAKSGAKEDQSNVLGKENENFSSHVSSDSLAIPRIKAKLHLTPALSKEIRDYLLKREETVDTLELDAKQNQSVQPTKYQQSSSCGGISSDRSKVFLIYDKRMNYHRQFSDDPESAKRIPRILANLKENGLLNRCEVSSKAISIDEDYVLQVHTKRYIEFIKKLPLSGTKLEQYHEYLSDVAEERDEFVSSKGTPLAAFLAAGAVVEACNQVAMGNFRSSFALVRPPGHHAKQSMANGFCFLNNVAIGARYLQRVHNAKKIFVVDFDVHHGDGTQEIFYQDDTVLFCSIHRETIFPRSEKKCSNIGEGRGKGFNVNIALDKELENSDLLAVFDCLFIPLAKQYNPDYILVSAGFDSAIGDTLGQSHVTPDCFGQLIRKLKSISDGRLVLALEGGYNLDSLADSCSECIKELLDNETTDVVKCRLEDVKEETSKAINQAKSALVELWPCLDAADPDQT